MELRHLKELLQGATKAVNANVASTLPLAREADEEAAWRGHIASLPEGGVSNATGKKAWNIADFDFLKGPCPATVNPSLWRMAQLNAISGLFEVVDGVWQARACDYANMTVIRGDTGWILVDPLMTRQTAAAALALVNETLGTRPVSAILITHTHPDHFGGLRGVAPDNVPIYAPQDFMTYAASEGVLGGNHTSRRAIYQFGLSIEAGPLGLVDGGIGKTVAKGERTFVEPTHFISSTGETHEIDGVRFEFQIASGTEAPAEFTFYLPDHKVLCMAEVCTQTLHNVLTPRGAQIRDALLWSQTIDEAMGLFSASADVLINCHNWPVWGGEALRKYLAEQRDIYKYIHDQTLRLANLGHTPDEIADAMIEPDWLKNGFHARGYYGTMKFNARAVYQMYYGFFDGHPVNLDRLPPEVEARHFIAAVGGRDATYDIAVQAVKDDALQWAATLLNHIVFSGEAEERDRALLAEVYRHLGYRAESGIMRNIYLSGAKEVLDGISPLPMAGGRNADLAATLPLTDWFNAYALRLNPERARGVDLALNVKVGDELMQVMVNRQVEFARLGSVLADADATLTLTQAILEDLAAGHLSLDEAKASGMTVVGDADAVARYFALHDSFDLWFPIVTP